jgi:hypothetical protein
MFAKFGASHGAQRNIDVMALDLQQFVSNPPSGKAEFQWQLLRAFKKKSS